MSPLDLCLASLLALPRLPWNSVSQTGLRRALYEEALYIAWNLERHPSGRCLTHHSWCPVRTGATCKMSGWPCQDHSSIGLMNGLRGKQLPISLAVGARSSLCGQALNAIECTPNMPRNLPHDAFGSRFTDWQYELVDPSLVGFEMTSRPRLLILFYCFEVFRNSSGGLAYAFSEGLTIMHQEVCTLR